MTQPPSESCHEDAPGLTSQVAPYQLEKKMNTEEIRKAYLPSRVRILLVAESPPSSGDFFYVDSGMTRYTMMAFEKAFGLKFQSTRHFLEYFKDRGCYLDDLTETPVNNLQCTEREQLLKSCVPHLSRRIKQMQPTVIITVLKRIETHVLKAIDQSGISTKAYTLPFPGNGHQNRYTEMLAEILHQHLSSNNRCSEPCDDKRV